MPFTQMRCKNCGNVGEYKYDDTTKLFTCHFCGSKFYKENSTYNTNYNYNFEGANVTMNDERSFQNILANAEINLNKFKDYSKAKALFMEVSQIKPDDYRGWWGLIRTATQEFTKFDLGQNQMNQLEFYYKRASIVANENIKNDLQIKWFAFTAKNKEWLQTNKNLLENNTNERDSLSKQLDAVLENLKREQDTYNKKYTSYISSMKKMSNEIESLTSSKKVFSILRVVCIFLMISGIIFGIFENYSKNYMVFKNYMFLIALAALISAIIFSILFAVTKSQEKKYTKKLADTDAEYDNLKKRIKELEGRRDNLNMRINEHNSKISSLSQLIS